MQEKQLVTGSIKIYLDNEQEKTNFFNKLDKAKLCVNEKITSVSNYAVLSKVLDYFLESHGVDSDQQPVPGTSQQRQFRQYLYCNKSETEQDLFVCSESAMTNIVHGIQEHAHTCKGNLDMTETQMFGHVRKCILKCVAGHTLRLGSSPHIEGGKFLEIYGWYME